MLHCSIVIQNIRSIRKNFDLFVASLRTADLVPDIICLTEVWVESGEVDLYNLTGYKLMHKCNDLYRSGGVFIYIKNNLTCRALPVTFASSDALCIEVGWGDTMLTLLCLYRLHRFPISVFLSELDTCLRDFKSPNVYIVGDMNINLRNSNDSDEYETLLSSYGFDSLINEPTRISDHSATCIDHIWARNRRLADVSNTAEVLHLGVTDHSMLSLRIDSSFLQQNNNKENNVCRKPRADIVAFNAALGRESWLGVLEERCASVAFDRFLSRFLELLEECRCEPSPGNPRPPRQPWISPQLCRKIRRKNAILKLCRKNPMNVRLANYSKKLAKDIRRETTQCRNEYFFNRFNGARGNMRLTWNVLNEITGRSCKHNHIDSVLSRDGNLLTQPLSIAEEFNNFFLEVPRKIALEINVPNDDYRIEFSNPESLYLSPVTALEVYKIIFSLAPSAACGYDDVSSSILRGTAWNVVDILSHLVNLSFQSGVFPEALKKAVVVPIHKKDNKRNVENYRPISLLSVFSKLYEKLMKSRLVSFLSKHNFLSDHQFGFREGRGCEQALEAFLDRVSQDLNDGKTVAALFLDVCKAFDTVNHDLLLRKIYAIGVRGHVFDWFCSYLSERQQCVRIGSELSGFQCVESGVPQGSILGPILFIIYMNDIHDMGLKGFPTTYADDLAITYSGVSVSSVFSDMEGDLLRVKLWFDHHRMLLSRKSRHMLFSLRGLPAAPALCLHSVDCEVASGGAGAVCGPGCFALERVSQFKYLGLILDQALSWRPHIESLRSHLKLAMKFCFRLRSSCPRDVMRSYYHAMVQSKLNYAVSFWGSAYSVHLRGLHAAQRIMLRIMSFKNRFESANPLFKDWRIFSLRALYVYRAMKIFFSRSGQRLIRPRSSCRDPEIFFVPRPKREFFRHCFSYCAPRLANLLFVMQGGTTFSFCDLRGFLLSSSPETLGNLLFS